MFLIEIFRVDRWDAKYPTNVIFGNDFGHRLSIYRYGTRACFLIIFCPHVRVSSRHPTRHAKLLWQVSSFEFSGKSIGKTVFEREKMHILQNWSKVSLFWARNLKINGKCCFCVEKIYDRVYSEFISRQKYKRCIDMTCRPLPTIGLSLWWVNYMIG